MNEADAPRVRAAPPVRASIRFRGKAVPPPVGLVDEIREATTQTETDPDADFEPPGL
jgi:hypothetical protein